MQERLAVIRYEDEAHFTDSQKAPGDFSALTRQKDDGTNRLGQVTFRDLTEEEMAGLLPSGACSYRHDLREQVRAEAARLAAELIVAAGTELARWAAPHVKLWLREQALPAAQQGWKRLRSRRRTGGGTGAVKSSSVSGSVLAPGSDADIAPLAAVQVEMSSGEAQARSMSASSPPPARSGRHCRSSGTLVAQTSSRVRAVASVGTGRRAGAAAGWTSPPVQAPE